MYTCKYCNMEFKQKSSCVIHEKWCLIPKKRDRNAESHKTCPKCGELLRAQGYKKHIVSCTGIGILRNLRNKNIGKGWNRGLTYIEIFGIAKAKQIREEISKKLKIAYFENRITGKSTTIDGEKIRTDKIRLKINERYKNGWEVRCGRCKKIDYDSPIAGKIKLDGNWEVRVATYFDKLGVKWLRNKKRFEYVNLIGKKSTYCPDFFIEDWNTYLEVKGYETELDKCKWMQFTEKLLVWKKQDLKKLNII